MKTFIKDNSTRKDQSLSNFEDDLSEFRAKLNY